MNSSCSASVFQLPSFTFLQIGADKSAIAGLATDRSPLTLGRPMTSPAATAQIDRRTGHARALSVGSSSLSAGESRVPTATK